MKLALIYEKFIATGGLEGYLYRLALSLLEHGHTLHVVTQKTDATTEQLAASTPRQRLTLHRLPRQGWTGAGKLSAFDRAANRLLDTLDVDRSLGFGRTSRQDFHRAGGGCHALYSPLLPWWKRLGLKNQTELALERKLYTSGQTPHFVVNSHQVARQLQRTYGLEANRFHTIHTAVHSQRFSPVESFEQKRQIRAQCLQAHGSTSEKASANASEASPVLLFVSSHHWRKGLDLILSALQTLHADPLPHVPFPELWILGRGLDSRWKKRIAACGLSAQVREFGEVPPEQMPDFYRTADFFLHPTRYDACANTALQALATGLVSLISCADGVIDHLTHHENALLFQSPRRINEPDGPAPFSDFSTALRHALSLSEEAKRDMGAKARETILPLTQERHLTQWLELLNLNLAAPNQ